jgi:Asp-tRNA(Asn)/Glu-tRNA(Gln) amidotransferase A subunit family amidase
MQRYQEAIADVDVYVHPTYGGSTLLIANLTGQPSVVVPHGFRENGTPASITFTGHLFGEADLLAVSMAFQNETGDHRRRPPGFL